MTIFKTIEKLSQLHYLVKNERTGNPEYLAKRLGISRSSLYNMIDELKSHNAPIEYSRSKESFFYTKWFELELKCTLRLIDDEGELKKIIGGCEIFSSVHFFGRKGDNFIPIS